MKFSIIAVGDEVLKGEVANTNNDFLAKSLMENGYDPSFSLVCGDKEADIARCLDLCKDSDLIVLTGGLGPTPDDLTRPTVASFFGLPLMLDAEIKSQIHQRFKKLGLPMPENNTNQAMVPKGAIPLGNPNGTAPGLFICHKGITCILLPGPPRELVPMWENIALPMLHAPDKKTFKKDYYIYGLGESAMAEKLGDILTHKEQPFVAPYASLGQVRLRVWARAKNQEDFEAISCDIREEIKQKLSDNIFEDTLEVELGKALRAKDWTLSTAESCTGGLIAKTLTDVPGSSDYFQGGCVSYSDTVKTKILEVSQSTLAEYGAVSEQVALEMAYGSKKAFGTDCVIATTGIAGPGGGTPNKPVGLVYICVMWPGGNKVIKRIFTGGRAEVRFRTMMVGLHEMLRGMQQV